MSFSQEEGILLRSHAYSETSRVLRVLTPGRGVLPLMARGLRRKVGRGEGAVDTFDQVQIVYSFRPHRDLQTLTELKVLRSRQALGSDLVRFSGASLLAEMLLVHALEEGSPTLFLEVGRAMDRLVDVESRSVAGVLISAGWRILACLGFAPELDSCVRCGAGLETDDAADGAGDGSLLRFSALQGGLLCEACGRNGAGSRLGPGARDDLRRLLAGTPPTPLRGSAVHLSLLEAFALGHLAPNAPFRAMDLLRAALEKGDR
ncbi:MAG: DNA repair protein RecO [Gemmatimonadales bacterium]|nr:MAG: DNA repair protein RecO [Gemmatimonadales bacterium]